LANYTMMYIWCLSPPAVVTGTCNEPVLGLVFLLWVFMAYKEKTIELIDKNIYQIENLIDKKIDIWFEHVLFSGLWYYSVPILFLFI
jgi:hypothetical protein